MNVKLTIWAKENGYTYRGAYNRFVNGGIPNAFMTPTGRIYVKTISDEEQNKPEFIVTYSRVSSHKQKDDLERQITRLSDFCSSSGMVVKKEYKEIASGLNEDRKVLNSILSNDEITTIVVENKDRLTRFGFNYLKNFSGKKIIVVNEAKEDKDDLIQDLISLINSMVAKYYGIRKTKNLKDKLLAELHDQK